MSVTYPERTETNFPEAVDNVTRMSDLSFEDIPLVQQYYSYYNAGNITAANAILEANPSLKNKIFNAAKFNKLADGIGAVQEYFVSDLQTYLNEQLTYREPYNPDSTYSKTNIVDFNGEGYICRIDNTIGVSPVSGQTTETWALIAKQGIQGASGIGLAPKGIWSSDVNYYTDDCVADNNTLWQCATPNINSKPSIANNNWIELVSFANLIITSTAQPTNQEVGNVWIKEII